MSPSIHSAITPIYFLICVCMMKMAIMCRRPKKFDGASGTSKNPLYEINFYNSFDHSGYDEVTG